MFLRPIVDNINALYRQGMWWANYQACMYIHVYFSHLLYSLHSPGHLRVAMVTIYGAYQHSGWTAQSQLKLACAVVIIYTHDVKHVYACANGANQRRWVYTRPLHRGLALYITSLTFAEEGKNDS